MGSFIDNPEIQYKQLLERYKENKHANNISNDYGKYWIKGMRKRFQAYFHLLKL